MANSRDRGRSNHPPPSTHDDRVKFLEDFALNYPHASIDMARKALLHRFGKALNQQLMANVLKMVKDLQPKHVPFAALLNGNGGVQQAKDAILECVRIMKEHGLRSITINSDGTFNIALMLVDSEPKRMLDGTSLPAGEADGS